jgi:hypothetical protein
MPNSMNAAIRARWPLIDPCVMSCMSASGGVRVGARILAPAERRERARRTRLAASR